MAKRLTWVCTLLCASVLALGAGIPAPLEASESDSIGPAFHIGGTAVFESPIADQINATVAFGGTGYLAVWNDYRTTSSEDIYGARLDVDGTVLDKAGFVISAEADDQETPAVAFDGTNYLVVWRDRRSGTSDIYGARVTVGGEVLDPDGIPISTATNVQSEVAIAFRDTAYLVAWTDQRDGTQNIYAARVTTQGTVLDTDGLVISDAADMQRYPAVSSDSTGWLIVWEDHRSGQADIYGARVAGDGTVLDSAGISISASGAAEVYPDVTSNGANYLVVWDDDRSGTSRDVYAARVAPDGTVLDAAGIPVCVHTQEQGYAAAGSYGSAYFVIWDDLRSGATWDIYGARLDSAGTVVDTTPIAVCLDPSQQFGLDLAFDGINWLVTWHDSRNGPKDIYGIRVASGGTVVDPEAILISSAAGYQSSPAVAFDGVNYLAVWHEWRSDTEYDVRGVRVSLDGTVLDSAGIDISAGTNEEMYPAVAFDGTNYLVVWQDYRNGTYDIYGTRITPEGTVLNPVGFPISSRADEEEHPAVAFDGTNYLVVWQDNRSGFYYDIYGSRVAKSGVVLNPAGIIISDATRHQEQPAVAYDGTNYLVVWQDARSVYNDIYGARVTTGGTLLDSTGIAISTASLAQEYPDLAFDGTNYVVTWQDKRGSSDYNIYLSRVGTDGTVLDPTGVVVSSAAEDQLYPAIAFDSRDYLIVWQDGRSATDYDIYATQVDTDGTVLDLSGMTVSTAANDQLVPDLSSAPFGVILITYASFIDPPTYGSYRIYANFHDLRAGLARHEIDPEPAWLCSSFPNPFSGATTLRLEVAEPGRVAVSVYDVEGRRVGILLDEVMSTGLHEITWDAGSLRGGAVAPGIYFCSVQTAGYSHTHKIILLH